MKQLIPFDSFVLSNVISEYQVIERGRVQRITQPAALDIEIDVHWQKKDYTILISADPIWARTYHISRHRKSMQPTPQFCQSLRKCLQSAFITSITQSGFDRVMEIIFEKPEGETYKLITEFMGKHSNIILIDRKDKIINAIKHINIRKSRFREVLPGKPYSPPPNRNVPNPLTISNTLFSAMLRAAENVTEKWLMESFEGISPFLAKELWYRANENVDKLPEQFTVFTNIVKQELYQPTLIRDEHIFPLGAYPLPSVQFSLDKQFTKDQLSANLEYVYEKLILQNEIFNLKQTLQSSIDKNLESKKYALSQLQIALTNAKNAETYQHYGDMILAFGHNIEKNASKLSVPNYNEQDEINLEITLDPELTIVENAQKYYQKAKRSKDALHKNELHRLRMEKEINALEAFILQMQKVDNNIEILKDLLEEAKTNGWLQHSKLTEKNNVESAFEGHRIRSIVVDGWQIMWGESATANDYLTQKVASSNDLWFHVRSSTSAHVIIKSKNKSALFPKQIIEQAANIAAINSRSKHSGIVPVDYTFKKYVRKPRGAKPGTVTYTNEKTIDITPNQVRG